MGVGEGGGYRFPIRGRVCAYGVRGGATAHGVSPVDVGTAGMRWAVTGATAHGVSPVDVGTAGMRWAVTGATAHGVSPAMAATAPAASG
jgi:hypothetical protein